MRVGINGMGRIGRLALRAGMGAMQRPEDDPRAGNRLDIAHLNEIKGGAGVTAHLLEFDSLHGRWRQSIGADDDSAIVTGDRRIGSPSLPLRRLRRSAQGVDSHALAYHHHLTPCRDRPEASDRLPAAGFRSTSTPKSYQ